jgi:hypothetical protein
MAEQQRTGGTRGSGLPSRAVASLPERGAVSAVASGSATFTSRTIRATSPEPEFPWRDTATLATYRMLLLKGLQPEEAANLTAFLCGIHVGDLHWKLIEVNRLLFLRRLARTGSWGAADGAPGRTH